jgi:hypothetical protein
VCRFAAFAAEFRGRGARHRAKNSSWKPSTYTRHRLPSADDLKRLDLEEEHTAADVLRSAPRHLL